ncbi:hypothetical protein LIER_42350 [Lithospermum erythrorhizon]|uniref:Uncharacterized protein n=1 Tax=Lithospermum erythrorhizon TaxID=34254 RepID=A0AAV3RNW7_LITER
MELSWQPPHSVRDTLFYTWPADVSHLMGKVLYVLGSDEQLNIGQVIFDQVIDHSKSHSTLKPIGFPSMICGILLAQKPNSLQPEDGVGVDVKPLMISE